MANIYDASRYILEQMGKMETSMLQKLLYYAQAWSLVWDDTPLFPEDFEAWGTGPVCASLRERFEGYTSIEAEDVTEGDSSVLTAPQRETVDVVLARYGTWDIDELIWQTQMADPWRDATRGHPGGCREIIPKDSIAMYYSGLD